MNLRSFLTIERTMGSIAYDAVARELDPARIDMEVALERGDYDQASRIAEQIDLTRAQKTIQDELPAYLRAAFLFGASLVHGGIRKTPAAVLDALDDDILDATAATAAKIAGEKAQLLIARRAAGAVADTETEDKDPMWKSEVLVRKASVANRLNAAVDGTGRLMSSISANLTTSRLVSYGFLATARTESITKYQLQAVLDDRTSEICQRLHGRVFSVEKAFEYTQEVLKTTDPEQLKSIAPFVKGTKANLKNLETASDEELEDAGVMVPPFHPGCRTVLILLSEETTEEVDYTPVDENLADHFKPDEMTATPDGVLLESGVVDSTGASVPVSSVPRALVSDVFAEDMPERPEPRKALPGDKYSMNSLSASLREEVGENGLELSEDKLAALRDYQSNSYQNVNSYMRGQYDDPEPEVARTAERMRAIFAEDAKTLSEDTLVYRGYNLDLSPKQLEGIGIIDNGIMSTSVSRNVALGFSEGNEKFQYVFEVKVPSGTKAVYVGRADKGERELMLPPGTRLVIDSVGSPKTVDGIKFRTVQAHVVYAPLQVAKKAPGKKAKAKVKNKSRFVARQASLEFFRIS